MKKVQLTQNIEVGPNLPFALLAGPCVIESEEIVLRIAEKVKKITESLGIPYVFKASWDKANRTSVSSYRGPGLEEGLRILEKVKKDLELPLVTDIHESSQAQPVSEVVDILQIPAFLCRQTDLLVAAAKTGKTVNVKKAQFLAPWDMAHVVKKLEESGAKNILLTERGTSFGYNTLVVDMRSLLQMAEHGYPIVFDATHSVQMPGGKGSTSGGNREYVEPLAKAAAAIGVQAFFMEVHENPEKALSDGPNMVYLDKLEGVLKRIKAIDEARRAN